MTGRSADRRGTSGAAKANLRVARWLTRALGPPEGRLEVVISPGSRNTPLAMAFDELAAEGRANLHVVLDERAAAFVALGLAKTGGRAAVLCCTSGSAAGHYVPAVMEAAQSRVPLILLTADRPPELHHCGAPQTVAQAGMFQLWARLSLQLAVPDEAADAARTTAIGRQLRRVAEGSPAGPVHLNAPFRKPLYEPSPLPAEVEPSDIAPLVPATVRPATAGPSPDEAVLAALGAHLTGDDPERGGVIFCGPRIPATLDAAALGAAVGALAERLGWPVLADAASGIGQGVAELVPGYDLFLRHGEVARALAPRCVLQLGAAPTSKAANQWLGRFATGKLLLVDRDGELADPQGLAGHITVADPVALCRALAARDLPRAAPHWLERWRRVAQTTEQVVADACRRPGWQGHLARGVVEALPAGALLHVASSMPIREVDAFAGPIRSLGVEASRGVNGIDGTLATFLGLMLARRSRDLTAPGLCLIGDLAFLHDLDGLATWAELGRDLPATAVIVDNGGGRIFDRLPIAGQIESDRFERLFATPQSASFEPLCAAFGHRHQRVPPSDLRGALADEIERPGLGVLVVGVDAAEDRRAHDEVLVGLFAALDRIELRGAPA